MFYAGIDWGDAHHDLGVIDDSAKIRGSLRITHSVSGLTQLNKFLKELVGAPSQLACIIETSQGLFTALLEAGWAVYPVNPKTVGGKHSAAGVRWGNYNRHAFKL